MRLLFICFLILPCIATCQVAIFRDTIIGGQTYSAIKKINADYCEVGQLKRGKETGYWKAYNSKGQLIIAGYYKKGIKEGLWENGKDDGSEYKYYKKGKEVEVVIICK